MFNPQEFRSDFPILSRQVHGKPLVYLDNAATSHKPHQVIEALTEYYSNHNANVHRGVHTLGDESTLLFHAARQAIAQFFGAKATELVVVRNTTEAVNLVAYAWGNSELAEGDVILLSELDHHSNIVPWQEIARRRGAKVEYLPNTPEGRLDEPALQHRLIKIGARLKLVAMSHVSNTLGTVYPIETVQAMLKAHRQEFGVETRFFVDGAQAAPHLPIKFDDLGADFYAVSAHKMLGPMGIGAVLVREELLQQLPPFLYGGGMIDTVTVAGSTFITDLEERFTAGTPDVAGLVCWQAACAYLSAIGMSQLLEHDRFLVSETLAALQNIPQVQVIGPVAPAAAGKPLDRVGSVAFVYQGVHAHDVGQVLDSEGVAVRSGHHCTMPLHQKMGIQASTRVSFQLYNTLEDVAALVRGLQKVAQVFGK